MKLLIEQSYDVQPLHEEVNGKKQLFIEGIFMQSNVINRNKRRYDKDTLMVPSVDKYINEYVAQRRGIGELKHPTYPIPDIEKAALLTIELKWDGDNVFGKALVLDTPQGNILRGLLEGGFNMGMSTRSLGSLQSNEGYSDVTSLIINAIDAVDMPSGPDCYVNPVNESVNWVQTQVGLWVAQTESVTKRPVDISELQQFVEDAISNLKSNKQRKRQYKKEPQMKFSIANITVGQIVKTAYGQVGQVFSTNGTTSVVTQIRSDNVYAEIGVFHNSKLFPV